MIIANFTATELLDIKRRCNFTDTELIIFELRSIGTPLNTIADTFNISINTVKKISRKINKKIIKAL